MEVQEVKEQLKSIFRQVINNDKWITIHPNGEDEKGKHLLLKDGESPKEAIERTYGKGEKSDTKDGKEETKKEYPSRHAEILYKDLPELREKLHKAKYERAKNKEKGADVSLYDKRIKEYEDKEQQLKDEMAELRDNRRSQKERYTSLIEEQKQSDTKDKQSDLKGEKKEIIAKAEKSLSSNKFIPNAQKSILKKDLKGEEYEHFADKIEEIQEQIKNAPKMYETDGKKDKKPILHYFGGSYDNYVYEIDKATGEMFGAVNMGYGYELGYSSMEEINSVPSIELDLYFDGKVPKELSKKVNNNKEQDMALIEELKKLITKVENTKGEEEMEIENEKVDKRKLIDEVGGILKGKVDDEVIRTIIGKMEKMSYDDSEASADNKKVKNEADEEDKKVDNEEDEKEDKKVDNEDEEDEEKVEELKKEEKKDVDNKCKNSKEENYFDKLNKIYNSAKKIEEPSADYESKQARLDAGKEYFG